jgi:hypothetical protein
VRVSDLADRTHEEGDDAEAADPDD